METSQAAFLKSICAHSESDEALLQIESIAMKTDNNILYAEPGKTLFDDEIYTRQQRIFMNYVMKDFSRREWREELSFFFLDASNFTFVNREDLSIYDIPYVDDLYKTPCMRSLSNYLAVDEQGNPTMKSRLVECRRAENLYIKAKFPEFCNLLENFDHMKK